MKIPENDAILLHVNITANFEHVGCIVSVSLLLTFNMWFLGIQSELFNAGKIDGPPSVMKQSLQN